MKKREKRNTHVVVEIWNEGTENRGVNIFGPFRKSEAQSYAWRRSQEYSHRDDVSVRVNVCQ